MPGISPSGTQALTTATNSLPGAFGIKSGVNVAATIAGVATAANPLGAALIGLGGVTSLLGGQKHAAAVKAEADALNAAVPKYIQTIQQIFALAGSGQMSPASASSAIDQAVAAYYSDVSSVIKKGGSCGNDPNTCGTAVDAKGRPKLNPCNGPCTVGCVDIERIACKAKKLLTVGGTMNVSPAAVGGTGYNAFSPFTLSYGSGQGIGSQLKLGTGTVPTQGVASGGIGVPLANGLVIPYSSGSTAALNNAALNQAGLLGPTGIPSLSGMTTGTWLLLGVLVLGGLYLAFKK